MMDPESSSSHHPHEVTEDRISSLPKTAIDAILIRLPIWVAVRTSILSRSWRYEWTNLSQIRFGSEKFPLYYDSEIAYKIDQVLLLHQGPIHRFELSFINLGNWKYIDRWILFLSRNGVREFVLCMPGLDGIFKIPSCLFSCKELVYLELSGCELTLPSSFRGFSNLKTLTLDVVDISKSSLEKLITMCPRLAKLSLRCISGCPNLTICAPSLVELAVESKIMYLCFEKTPVLAKASIDLSPDAEKYQPTANGGLRKLTTLLRCLPAIKRLELPRQTYEILSRGEVPVKLLGNCQLSYLSAGINFEDREQLSTAFWIFRSCPLLQEVEIKMQSTVNENTEDLISWDTREDYEFSLNHLKILRVSFYSGTKAELRFIEFVLANAPVLEIVHIELKEDFEAMDLFRDLLQLRRISSNSRIVIPK